MNIIIWKNTSTNINMIIIFFQNLSFFIIHSDQGPRGPLGPRFGGIASYVEEVQALLPRYHLQSRRFGGISKATKAKAAPVLGAGFGAMAQWEEGGKNHEERWGINGWNGEFVAGDLGVAVLCNHHHCVGGWMVRPSKMLIEEIYWSLFGSPFSWLKGGFPG